MTYEFRRYMFRATLALTLATAALIAPPLSHAQSAQDSTAPTAPATPTETLTNILSAACRDNEAQFSTYLAGENTAAFRALSPELRSKVIQRISLSDAAGKPLLATGKDGLPTFRCQAPSGTVEYHLGIPRVHDNLAFIPVTVVDVTDADFGLIHETGGWHLLSIGLVLLDIPQLTKQWQVADAAARDEAAVKNLGQLAEAIRRYNRVFGKLPESLTDLGPAPKDQISEEQAGLVDKDTAAGKKDGYAYRYRIVPDSAGNDTAFELAATPEKYPQSGKLSYFLDTAGKVHGADNQGVVSSVEDPLIPTEKSE
jgi:type II secretory pathway pseudopilin PulG